jgi:hypothetical protein
MVGRFLRVTALLPVPRGAGHWSRLKPGSHLLRRSVSHVVLALRLFSTGVGSPIRSGTGHYLDWRRVHTTPSSPPAVDSRCSGHSDRLVQSR